MNANDLEENFKKIIFSMTKLIVLNLKINITENKIKEIINSKGVSLIDFFLKYIYLNEKYSSQIKNKDDHFYSQETFSEITEPELKDYKKLFKVSKVWHNIDNNIKDFIKKAFIGLLDICDKYVVIKYSTH